MVDKDSVHIEHQTGRKDDYLVVVRFDEPADMWTPTNDKVFEWLDLWFQSEDEEFGEKGYGRWLPWFYVSMIALGYGDKAQEAYQKRGYDAVRHFEDVVDEHADELLEVILKIKNRDKKNL